MHPGVSVALCIKPAIRATFACPRGVGPLVARWSSIAHNPSQQTFLVSLRHLKESYSSVLSAWFVAILALITVMAKPTAQNGLCVLDVRPYSQTCSIAVDTNLVGGNRDMPG